MGRPRPAVFTNASSAEVDAGPFSRSPTYPVHLPKAWSTLLGAEPMALFRELPSSNPPTAVFTEPRTRVDSTTARHFSKTRSVAAPSLEFATSPPRQPRASSTALQRDLIGLLP